MLDRGGMHNSVLMIEARYRNASMHIPCCQLILLLDIAISKEEGMTYVLVCLLPIYMLLRNRFLNDAFSEKQLKISILSI